MLDAVNKPRRNKLKNLLQRIVRALGRNDITPPEIKRCADIKAKLGGKSKSKLTESDAMRLFWIADKNHDYLLTLDEWVSALLPRVNEYSKERWAQEQIELRGIADVLRKRAGAACPR